jgi:hypothetical protein
LLGQETPESRKPIEFGKSFVVLKNGPKGPGSYAFEGYWSIRASRPLIFSPGGVLIIGERNGIELAGKRYVFGLVVVVEGTEQEPAYRVARPADRIVLTEAVTVFGKQYDPGRFVVPPSGSLAVTPAGRQAGRSPLASAAAGDRLFIDATGKRMPIPDWFPLYPGVAVKDLQKDPAGNADTFVFTTQDPVDKVIAFYQEQLEKAGLKVHVTKATRLGRTSMGGVDAADADKTRTASISVYPVSGTTVQASVWDHSNRGATNKK